MQHMGGIVSQQLRQLHLLHQQRTEISSLLGQVLITTSKTDAKTRIQWIDDLHLALIAFALSADEAERFRWCDAAVRFAERLRVFGVGVDFRACPDFDDRSLTSFPLLIPDL